MVQEGVPGAMRGVRVNRLPRDQQFGGERGGRGFGVGGRGTRLPPVSTLYDIQYKVRV